MPSIFNPRKKSFELADAHANVFAEICKTYGLDSCWLQWQYEKQVNKGHIDPPCKVIGNSIHHPVQPEFGHGIIGNLKFEIQYDVDDPNDIKYVEFSVQAADETRYFIVTQTSMLHCTADNECNLWLETTNPSAKAAKYQNFRPCCAQWTHSIPDDPVTGLERYQLVTAAEDNSWLKRKLHDGEISRAQERAINERQAAKIKCLEAEVRKLKKTIEEQQEEIEELQPLVRSTAAKTRPGSARKITPKKAEDDTPPQTPVRLRRACVELGEPVTPRQPDSAGLGWIFPNLRTI